VSLDSRDRKCNKLFDNAVGAALRGRPLIGWANLNVCRAATEGRPYNLWRIEDHEGRTLDLVGAAYIETLGCTFIDEISDHCFNTVVTAMSRIFDYYEPSIWQSSRSLFSKPGRCYGIEISGDQQDRHR
jgi:hypothetical protein